MPGAKGSIDDYTTTGWPGAVGAVEGIRAANEVVAAYG
jgi:hypothetical protein